MFQHCHRGMGDDFDIIEYVQKKKKSSIILNV